jgi:hypothetical protein
MKEELNEYECKTPTPLLPKSNQLVENSKPKGEKTSPCNQKWN